ncbi:MAG TPA: carboxypeptidase regulatory-like domain-containing protein [Blastocatellia bacterium]
MHINSLRKKTPMLFSLALLLAVSVFAQTSASLSGTIHDPQGSAVIGAKVTLKDAGGTTQLETVTNSEGFYIFPIIQPATYTVTIEATGFKKVVKTGIVVNASDRQSTGVTTLEVGDIATTVEVTADAAQLQIKTESGEQGNAINNQQIQNLAVNGRNYLDLLKITPGVVATTSFATSGPGGLGNINVNGTRPGKNNLTIDGTTNVDTGSNGTQHIALSLDNIAEFKLLTSNYQAEYGRSGGGAIQIVTKSGTSEFHGTGYYFHRHEQFNANSFLNNAVPRVNGIQPNQRNFYRYNQQGFNVGGPVLLPKKALKDKLFFFFSQEWQEQLVPQNARQSRVPTSDEVNGNFSNLRNGNGDPILLRDPDIAITDTVKCQPTPANPDPNISYQGACFPDNRIPKGRINLNGQRILQLFNKFENTPFNTAGNGFQYNHNSQLSVSYPRRETSIRVDYNLSDTTKAYVRYTRDADQQIMPYGLGWTGGNNQIPFDNLIFKQAPAWNSTLNVTSALSSTLTNEFIFGASQNNLTLNPTNPTAGSYDGIGFDFALPFAGYPPAQWFNITFADVPNQNFGGSNGYSQFPYKNSNTTFDIYDNVSKVVGTHTLKAGIYYQRSRKDQAAGDSAAIVFRNNPNDPRNTGHPYANALLGNFDTFRQPNIGIFQGQYRSTNIEWYLQDNWKVNNRLTLDYGMRFNLIYPQYDKRFQDFYFVPEKYDPAQAVRLYRPTCANGAFVNNRFCATNADQRAFDPANPDVLLPAFLIGRIVPGSGNPFNGMVNGKDLFPGGIKSRGVQFGPAFGFAYDLFGDKKTVLRGGYRLGYDRVQGNELAFAAVGQPPLFFNPTFNFGNLATVGQSAGDIALGVTSVIAADPEGHIPSVQSFSLQLQHDLGWNTVLSVGYVGTLSRHQQELLNLNYSPYGELFTAAAQDPSRYAGGVVPTQEAGLAQMYKDAGVNFSGANALQSQFLKRYQGYDTIGLRTFGGSSNYHSMQATLNKRFGSSLNFGLAYTWSKAMGTANNYTDFINPVCSRCADYRRLDFDRTHLMVINYDWQVPGLRSDNWFLKYATNGWQVTGITQFISGQPADVNAGIAGGININQRIGGSWTEPVRGIFAGNPNASKDRDKYFNFETISLPTVSEALAARGAYPRNFLSRPGTNVTDLSLFKNIPLGGDNARKIQLRFEMFNIFNQAQFSDMNRNVQWSSFDAYLADQSAATATINNRRNGSEGANSRIGNGVGEVNALSGAVSPNRIIQLAVKVFF